MSINIEILLTAIMVSSACALLGVFLVLKSMAMVSDAITHTILLGIVIGFFIVHDLNSPFLILGASIIGVLTVYLIDMLILTKLVKEDSAIGIIFPFLFSIAVILISKFLGNVHLDIDAVLLGELAFIPFDRITLFGNSIPKGLLSTFIILLINLSFVTIFFKELKLTTFDKALAATLGFFPIVLNYIFITLVSVTVLGSFEAVGSILVVAFMIGPAITAYLLTDRLHLMILLSIFIGIISSVLGFYISIYLDISIAGTIAVTIGFIFLIIPPAFSNNFLTGRCPLFLVNSPASILASGFSVAPNICGILLFNFWKILLRFRDNIFLSKSSNSFILFSCNSPINVASS